MYRYTHTRMHSLFLRMVIAAVVVLTEEEEAAEVMV
jgi:hypothetical protein